MEIIKNEDGSITKISTFSEIFVDKDLCEISSEEDKLKFTKEVIERFDNILLSGQNDYFPNLITGIK